MILLEKDLPDPWRAQVLHVANSQIREGPDAGVFRNLPCHGRGEVLTTALAVLTLEHALYLR